MDGGWCRDEAPVLKRLQKLMHLRLRSRPRNSQQEKDIPVHLNSDCSSLLNNRLEQADATRTETPATTKISKDRARGEATVQAYGHGRALPEKPGACTS